MIRPLMNVPANRLASFVIIVAFAQSSAAQAQIVARGPITTSVEDFYVDQDDNPLAAAFTHLNISTADNSAGNLVDFVLQGDWNYKLTREKGTGAVLVNAFLPFTVGDLPIRISDFQFRQNAKWVNSGGGPFTPVTTAVPFAWIREDLNDPDNDPVAMSAPPLSPGVSYTFTGNGATVVGPEGHSSSPTSYVFSPDTSYYLHLRIRTSFNNTLFDVNGMPTVSITNEFGGDLSSYDGFEGSFTWQAVPEPGTLALAGCGGAALAVAALRRWRRATSRRS
jgi:hypothetical protein